MRYRLWQTEIGNCGSFLAFTLPLLYQKKSEFWKNEKKNCWRYHHFTQAYQKPQSYEVQFLRYGARQTEFFVIFGHFLPFTPLTTRKIKILKQWKKHLEMSSLYTCVPKITIIWCMLPEIWNTTDLIFCHFGPFFALLAHYWPQK